jgi:hypothetical protein
MPIDKIYKPDVEVFHRTMLDAKRLAVELHQRVAADQREVECGAQRRQYRFSPSTIPSESSKSLWP